MGRATIVGAGVIAPSGTGRHDSFLSLMAGQSKVRAIDRFDPSLFNSRVAAQIYSSPGDPCQVSQLDLALIAAHEAISEAGVSVADFDALVFASAVGESAKMESCFIRSCADAPAAFPLDSAGKQLAQALGFQGALYTQTTGCTAGLDAVGLACDLIETGVETRILVVASETPITPVVLASFDRIGAVARFEGDPTFASRPFDRDRCGFVLGEGAGALVLEARCDTRQEERKAVFAVKGWHSVSSGFHMTAIRQDGSDIARAIEGALRCANITPNQIDLLDLHATSTKQNDAAEAAAVRMVFGARSADLPVVAQKSINGHALGASNLIELVNALTILERGTVPKATNLFAQDAACEVFLPREQLEREMTTLLKVSSGFSGIHTAMVIEKGSP
ncbi:beta-ketoacyl-[acyl-carrier-protein] synthase family protein [Allorhizobium pseudoryzae]|uniref:beta-ketoacyl-[acyl-carrier-protein] synthase family protein n=1 Tax=Allorhizobium pseudoryzae TaxID=379684 RepID=UPI003D08F656